MADTPSRTIFVVVDPSQDKPLALQRVMNIADPNIGDVPEYYQSAKVHIFLAVDSDNTDTSAGNPAIHRPGRWFFDQVVEPLEKSGINFELEMSWSSDWYGSIVQEAERANAELIMLPLVSTPSEKGRIFNESIWRLMRTAKSPVMVIRPNSPTQRKVILSAINIQSHKPEYQRLNDLIIERTQGIARAHNAELHFVNAYSDSLHYPDRSQLATKTGVASANIHVKAGNPEDVIAEVAREIGADVVVLGTRTRGSRWRGNTAERIVTRVDCDILAIN